MGDLPQGFDYPAPRPPTRDVELIRSSVNIPGPCCACKRRLGTLTCGGCKAVKYCSKGCQKKGSPWAGTQGWEDHEYFCNKIKKHRKETEDAIEALAECFGGIDALLESPLVKEGSFQYHFGEFLANNPQEEYILCRIRLTESYAKCGQEAKSCTAFRLAAENMLDIFSLCSNITEVDDTENDGDDNIGNDDDDDIGNDEDDGIENDDGGDIENDDDEDDGMDRNVESDKYVCCGWMVAAGMDQEALNFLCYFQHRLQSTISLPYLDLSKDEDIEGDSYLKLLKDPKGPFDLSTEEWFHDFMLIALIKYKRLQYLMVQKQKDVAAWKMFLMGTHPRAGIASTIQKLRGNYPTIKKIQDYVMEEEIDFRIDQLNTQIEQVLTAVNGENPFIIPVIIDVGLCPTELLMAEGSNLAWAFINYGHAWNMSPSYPRVLQKFLNTDHVLSPSTFLRSLERKEGRRLECNPVEGFLQAAFDVDPTKSQELWDSNHGHVLAVVNRFIPCHFMTTRKPTSCHNWLKQTQWHNATAAPILKEFSSLPLLLEKTVPGLYQRSTEDPYLNSSEATLGYSRTTDYCSLTHQVPSLPFSASEPKYNPYKDGKSYWKNFQFTPERITLSAEMSTNPPERFTFRGEMNINPQKRHINPQERHTNPQERHTNPPEKFTQSAEMFTNPLERFTFCAEKFTYSPERSNNPPERFTLRAEMSTGPEERSRLREERYTNSPEWSTLSAEKFRGLKELWSQTEDLDDDVLGALGPPCFRLNLN